MHLYQCALLGAGAGPRMGSGHFVRHGLCLQGALYRLESKTSWKKALGSNARQHHRECFFGCFGSPPSGNKSGLGNPGKLQGGGRAWPGMERVAVWIGREAGRSCSEYSESCCHCQRPFEALVLGMAGRQDKLEMQCVCFLGARHRDEHQGCRRKCSCCEMPKMINPCAKVEAEPSGYDFMVRASLSPRRPRRRSVLSQVWSSPIHWVEDSLQPQHLYV